MGYILEELIRKFAESNSTQAGDHFTPREVIALMVDILFHTQDDVLTKPGTVRTIYEPAAGTGGMLSTAYDHLVEMNLKARPVLYGQDVNPGSYAMCKSDMIIKGQDVDNTTSATPSPTTDSGPSTSTSCCPIPLSGWPGIPSRRWSPMNTRSAGSRAVVRLMRAVTWLLIQPPTGMPMAVMSKNQTASAMLSSKEFVRGGSLNGDAGLRIRSVVNGEVALWISASSCI